MRFIGMRRKINKQYGFIMILIEGHITPYTDVGFEMRKRKQYILI